MKFHGNTLSKNRSETYNVSTNFAVFSFTNRLNSVRIVQKEEPTMEHVIHQIPPVFDSASQILILGSFPSVKSREAHFFYHHPQNRFWKVLAALFRDDLPDTVERKKEFLKRHHLAVWDVIASCDIQGSSDSSIQNAVPNDISEILKAAPIRWIYTNGGTAYKLYHKYCEPQTGQKAIKLPSTSPANASFSLERLIREWKVLSD